MKLQLRGLENCKSSIIKVLILYIYCRQNNRLKQIPAQLTKIWIYKMPSVIKLNQINELMGVNCDLAWLILKTMRFWWLLTFSMTYLYWYIYTHKYSMPLKYVVHVAVNMLGLMSSLIIADIRYSSLIRS